jgi:hypothetical protein
MILNRKQWDIFPDMSCKEVNKPEMLLEGQLEEEGEDNDRIHQGSID